MGGDAGHGGAGRAARFRVLGSLEVVHEGERVPLSGMKAKALAVLLLEPGRWVPAQRFTDVLWDDEPPSTSVRQVQNALAALRRVLADHGGDPIERSGLGYRLDSEDIDLTRFEKGHAAGREALRAGDASTAAAELKRALGHWRGSPLADLSGARLEAAALRLERRRLAALEALNDAEFALGRNESVVSRARELLDADPYRQGAAAQLMRALGAQGRGVEALDAYSEIRGRLVGDLGLEPDRELQDAQRRILADGPGPPAPTSAAPSVPGQLPAPLNGFCCRDNALKALDELLDAESGALRMAVISGSGGVGKTSLAVEWAHGARRRFPDGQLHVDLRGFDPVASALDPSEALHGFLTALGAHPSSVPRDLDARADLYRSMTADRRMLVVLDNARDAEQVRPLLPGSTASMVLVTGRRPMPGLVVRHGATQLRLDVFGRAEARELVRRRLGAERVAAEPEAVDRILDACAGLPLALAIAAAQASTEPHLPLGAIADRLDSSGPLDALAGEGTSDLRAAFGASYRTLSTKAAALFRLSGLHPGPELSRSAAASLAGIPLRESRAPLRELADARLLTESAPDRYRSHDLLRAYARELVEEHETEAALAEARHRLFDHFLQTGLAAASTVHPGRFDVPVPRPLEGVVVHGFDEAAEAEAWFADELDSLVSVLRASERAGFDGHTAGIAWALSGTLYRRGLWVTGLETQEAALRAARRTGDRVQRATAHIESSAFLYTGGDFDGAEAELTRALEWCDPDLDAPMLAKIHQQFMLLAKEAGRFADALEHARTALRLFETVGDDRGRVYTLQAAGWFQAELGRLDEGLRDCERALALGESIDSPTARAQALDGIGHVLGLQGRQAEAAGYFERAVELSREHGYRRNEAIALDHLGEAHRSIGDDALAARAWRRALAVYEGAWADDAARMRAKLADLGAD